MTVEDIFKDGEVLNCLNHQSINTKIESLNPLAKQNVDSTNAEPRISTFVLQMKKQNNIIKAQQNTQTKKRKLL